jgi:hypothetical protein
MSMSPYPSLYAGLAFYLACGLVATLAAFELVGSYWKSHGSPHLRDLLNAGCFWWPMSVAAAIEALGILAGINPLIVVLWLLVCWMFAVRSFGKRVAA